MRTHGSRWAFALALALVATTGGLWARDLTFEDRVKAQEAIERVYWNHRIWPKENPEPNATVDGHARLGDPGQS